jgi:hypothetical protein
MRMSDFIQKRTSGRCCWMQDFRVSAETEALKIFPHLLGCRKELLLDMMRRRRPFGFKSQLEMADDPVDGFRFFDKRDDAHPAATYRAK